MTSTARRAAILGVWLSVLVLCAASIAWRLTLSYDLGLFLPAAQTAQQRVLLERLGDAPGSRYIVVAIEELADSPALDELRMTLAADPAFERVITGESLTAQDSVPEPLWTWRYLLDDADFSSTALARALRSRRAELGLLGGGRLREMIQADPTLQALASLGETSIVEAEGGEWRSADGRYLMLVETRAPAFDLAAQGIAVAGLRQALAAFPREAVEISGVGVFGVELRESIQREAQLRSIAASVALALVLLVAYRRLAVLWLAALPLASAMLVGLAVTATLLGHIHGITLAFGFTLLGIAIDYPLHLFSHARRRAAVTALHEIWPTLRLGALSTLLAYLAVAFSGSEGLAQLGCFTATGIAAAALTTRYVLPQLYGRTDDSPGDDRVTVPKLRFRPALLLALSAAAVMLSNYQGSFWNDDLSALSPLPREALERDAALRRAVGTPDLRYLIVQRSPKLPALLNASQSLSDGLPEAVDAGWIAGFQSISSLLPAAERQRRRRDALPAAPTLRERITAAAGSTGFASAAFRPFEEAVAASRELPLLRREDYLGSPLQGLVEQLLYRAADDWVAVVALFDPQDPAALQAWLRDGFPEAQLVDLREASQSLVVDYRARAFRVLAAALVMIALLLLLRVQARRAVWCLLTALLCMGSSAALIFALAGPLNLYHLIGLLLVGGLGLDYALFLSLPSDRRSIADSRHAVGACAASTTCAFAILAFSDIPALGALGSMVAAGTAISYLAARAGART